MSMDGAVPPPSSEKTTVDVDKTPVYSTEDGLPTDDDDTVNTKDDTESPLPPLEEEECYATSYKPIFLWNINNF